MTRLLTSAIALCALALPATAGAGSVSISTHSVVRGGHVAATVTARGGARVTFLLSRDRVASRGDVRLGKVAVRGRHRRPVRLRAALTIPRTQHPATYHLLACAATCNSSAPLTVTAPAVATTPADDGTSPIPSGDSPAPSADARVPLHIPPLPGPPAPYPSGDPLPCAISVTHLVATSPTTIVVTTSAPLDPTTVTPVSIIFSNQLGDIPGPAVLAISVSGDELTLTTTPLNGGQYYQLLFSDPHDAAGDTLGQAPTDVLGYTSGADPEYVYDQPAPCVAGTMVGPSGPLITPMYVTGIIATSPTTVVVTFNEPVDPSTVLPNGSGFPDSSEFGAGGPRLVNHATVDGATVTLTTLPQSPSVAYQLLFSLDIKSVSGDPLDQDPTTFGGYGGTPST